MKNRKKIIAIGIAAAAAAGVIAGILYFCLVKDTGTDKKSQPVLEEYSKDKEEEWSKSVRDFSGQLSDEEIETTKNECLDAIEGFNQVMFTFDQETADYTDILNSLYVPEGTEGSDRAINSSRFNDFRKMNVESSYLSFEAYSVVINDRTDVPTVVVNGLMSISYGSNNIPQGDYDVCSKYVLEKRDGKWLIYSSRFSTIYEAGTVKASRLSSDENTITYSGKRVGYFQSSY